MNNKNQPAKHPANPGETSFLYIRCKPADKGAWVRKAVSRKQKLADFVVETLNKETK